MSGVGTRALTVAAAAIVAVLVAACGFSASRDQAQVHAERYFHALRSADIDGALAAYSPEFFATTARGDWSTELRALVNRFGPVQHYELTGWRVDNRVGSYAGTHVTLIYRVTYDRGTTEEQFTLFNARGDEFLIVGHRLQLPDPLSAAPDEPLAT